MNNLSASARRIIRLRNTLIEKTLLTQKKYIFRKIWKICFIDKNITWISDKYKENNWANSINNLVHTTTLCSHNLLGGNFNKFIQNGSRWKMFLSACFLHNFIFNTIRGLRIVLLNIWSIEKRDWISFFYLEVRYKLKHIYT